MAIAVVGLAAIAVGAMLKTGFVRITDGPAPDADSVAVTPQAAAGEVAAPPDASPARPATRYGDTLATPSAPNDTSAIRPTGAELAALAAQLIVPVAGVEPGRLIDTFDEPRGTRRHNALDIPAPRGTPVLSATDGRVLRVFSSEAGGLMIYAADASERFVLMYAHLDRYADQLRDGMPVRRGDTIGYVGTTGNAPPTVPHLHFAIARTKDVSRWWAGTPVDPLPLLQRLPQR